jgi:FRG domain
MLLIMDSQLSQKVNGRVLMDANEFMALLRASNPVWHEDDVDLPRWIFRGHRDASWRLKPRAWRSASEGNPLHKLLTKLASLEVSDAETVKPGTALHRALAWTHAEKIVLNEFRRIGWQMGFGVIEPSSEFSMDLAYGPSVIDDTRAEPDCYSPFIAAEDIGIAQHYGIPTRFLDWTFNPIFAVFFAQQDFAQGLDNTDLCVWALDMNAITTMHHWESGVGRNLMRSLVPRRQGNDFITAQDGVLLEVEHKWALSFFERAGKWPDMHDVVYAVNRKEETIPDEPEYYLYHVGHPLLRRIVLPASEIPQLRLMLRREGVTREKLMPTLENVARAAVEAISEVKKP